MIFKDDWEKATGIHSLTENTVANMVALAYPEKRLILQELIADGCANLNIKVQLEGEKKPLLLRIYLRDKDAAMREQSLASILLPSVPAPLVLQVGDYENYRFAITEFVPGITLRDLLLSDELHDVGAIMFDVGAMLAKIGAHVFPVSGFFDENLRIRKELSQQYYLQYAKELLHKKIVTELLGYTAVANINLLFDKYAHLFPTEQERHLVHADFDPANILIIKIGNDWQISGILDWEFAFSGSILCDVANMLRYAHEMPAIYEEEFLHGLTHSGGVLPDYWRETIDLLNLFSLLDCLARSDHNLRPQQCADICALIVFIEERLKYA